MKEFQKELMFLTKKREKAEKKAANKEAVVSLKSGKKLDSTGKAKTSKKTHRPEEVSDTALKPAGNVEK